MFHIKCSILSLFLLLLLIAILNTPVLARGGGGRGGGGGGRGSSGARSSSSGSSSSHSSSGGSRTSYTSSSSNYRSSSNTQYNTNFRTNVFHTTSTSTYFMSSPMHTHVIISPYTPMVYGGYHYYWGGHYVQNQERPLQCEYEITESDEELRNVTFSNGTSAKTLSFGCRGSEKCCGLECCSDSSSLWVAIGIIVGITCMVIFCRCCSRNGCCDPQPSVVVGVPVLATTTTTTSYTGSFNTNGPFPGNDGPNFQQSPQAPPGFYPPPPQGPFNQYPPPPQGPFNQYPNAPSAPYDNRPMSTSQVQTGMKY